MFQQIDLGVTMRSGSDVFREEAVGLIISWLADLSASSIGGDEDLFRRLLAGALREPRINKSGGHGTPLPPDLESLAAGNKWGGGEPRRVDWLMQVDARLWKQAKWELRQIYAHLYGLDWDVRKDLGKSNMRRQDTAADTRSTSICDELCPHV